MILFSPLTSKTGQHVLLKRWYLFMKPQGITSQQSVIYIAYVYGSTNDQPLVSEDASYAAQKQQIIA